MFDCRFQELSSSDKSRISNGTVNKLVTKIEAELYRKLAKGDNIKNYLNKARSLIFNLRDPKNNLYRKVILGKIAPERLVNMSSEDLANSELKHWRENEKKQSIEMIKRDAADHAHQTIVKKTHKGEVIISKDEPISELPGGDVTEVFKNGEYERHQRIV